tara:strand:- start:23 stop:445 length:423 start_codon:yes stop_codon:yes gene_type:complete
MRDSLEYQRDAQRVTIGLLIVVLIIKAIDPYVGNTSDKEHDIARNFLEQANQWYLVSVQDTNSSSRYQHISYAAAYLHAARYVVNDAVLERLTGIDVHGLQSAIDMQQRNTNGELVRQCPRLKVNPKASVGKSAKRTAWL